MSKNQIEAIKGKELAEFLNKTPANISYLKKHNPDNFNKLKVGCYVWNNLKEDNALIIAGNVLEFLKDKRWIKIKQ